MTEYFTIESVPGQQFFRCDRYRATLSTTACAGNWRRANHDNDDERYRCKSCPLGAIHAGETAASMSPMMGTTICARCHRMAPRLIRGMICVSCYNREREWLIGKNAKGTKPVKLMPLGHRRIRYMAGDRPHTLALQHTADTVELMVAALRDSKKTVAFGFAGQMRGRQQLRIF